MSLRQLTETANLRFVLGLYQERDINICVSTLLSGRFSTLKRLTKQMAKFSPEAISTHNMVTLGKIAIAVVCAYCFFKIHNKVKLSTLLETSNESIKLSLINILYFDWLDISPLSCRL